MLALSDLPPIRSIQLLACSRCGAQNDPAAIICGRCAFGLTPHGIEEGPTLPDSSHPTKKRVLRLESSLFDQSNSDLDLPVNPSAIIADSDPLIGMLVADRYRIVEPLGRGGMGVVYKVEHVELHKLLALKLLTGELGRDRAVVRRFKREALLASKLSHPNTVQVFDFGNANGLAFLVMELIHGQDLSRLLRLESALSVFRMARIIVQVCSSLAEAHQLGIVHRDIKLGNIMVARTRDGTEIAKVLDFGLAKLRETPALSEVTMNGAVVGTPAYMAPEQIQGKAIDGRTDIYALGMVMYRLVTDLHPFKTSSPMSVMTSHLSEAPVAPHQRRPELPIPKLASEIILRCIQKNPKDRYQSIEHLQQDLIKLIETSASEDRHVLISASEIQGLAENVLRDAATEAETLVRRSANRPLVRAIATRDEIAAFKRKLEIQKWITRAVSFSLVAAATFAGARLYSSFTAPPSFTGREIEPNNESKDATELPFGATAKATIGRRIDAEHSDRDFYRVVIPAGTSTISLRTSALPNMATCTLIYGGDSQLHAGFCTGHPNASLQLDALKLEPGSYLFAVLQDRERYGAGPPPLVVESISDEYEFAVGPATMSSEVEIEPNDSLQGASMLGAAGSISGKLNFANDVDVVCAPGLSRSNRFQWLIVDSPDAPRERDTVLEVTPLAEPDTGLPIRIHHSTAKGNTSAQDVISPATLAPTFLDQGFKTHCLKLRLTTDPWTASDRLGPAPGARPGPQTWHVRLVRVD